MSFQPKFADSALNELSYYKTGGESLGVLAPSSIEELANQVRWLKEQNAKFYILGGGTNSLLSDEFWNGYVICFEKMREIEGDVSREIIAAQAGADNSDIVRLALNLGLGDLSWMYRLPGQIGGTTRMNARCYGGEISEFVSKITTVDLSGDIKHYENPKSLFRGYKDTVLMETGEIVASVELKLSKVSNESLKAIEEKMRFCEKDRIDKGQFKFPTCGCVFKNNYDPKVSVSSGFLLEMSGVKESSFGGAVVSPGHANFIYNQKASAADIVRLSLMMRQAVYGKFGVWLEYEMEILGELPAELKEEVERQMPLDPSKEDSLAEIRELFRERLKKAAQAKK